MRLPWKISQNINMTKLYYHSLVASIFAADSSHY